jgi:tetratricopeptide (TPR) repeat protein
VLEGTVRRAGDLVRISAQLIDARTDAHVWAEHYDRKLADVFAIESEVAEQIVAQLQARLSPREKAAIEERPTSNVAAYDLYVRAKALMAKAVYVRPQENLFDAATLLNDAVARDPAFFLGYCRLASVHDQIYLAGIDHTPERLALADSAVQAALKLRPDSGETHLALVEHLYCGYLDYDRARHELAIARQTLPNEARVFELTGYIDRRQGRWDESTRNLARALELDPRNFYILQQIAQSYDYLRRFADETAMLDRALTVFPKDIGARIQRAAIELEWHADLKPVHAVIHSILSEDPDAAPGFANDWLDFALCERDFAEANQALASLTPEGSHIEGFAFPRAWCEGLVARTRGDAAGADSAFKVAYAEIEKIVREQPGYAQPLCILGLIDAGLGRKEEAIREGRRAVELLPLTRDSINGTLLLEYLAVIYAWTGEKDLALEQLAALTRIPSNVSYGRLRLHPYWDPLRGDPRFEKIIASLAPSAATKAASSRQR